MKLKTIVYVFLVVCALFFIVQPVSASLYSSWSAHSTVTMNVTAPENNIQVRFTNTSYTIPLSMWNEMNQDGNDTRILNHDHTIEFPFWIEHLTARDNYSIWVKVTNNDSNIYQWYYGNSSANSTSRGNTTFEKFDDFIGSSLKEVSIAGDVTISATAGKYEAWPAIAKNASGDLFTVYRTCDSDTHAYEATGRIVIRNSTDSGLTWGSEIVVANAASPIDDRSGGGLLIFDDNGIETILMAYFEMDASNNYYAYVVKSIDNGVTWGSKIALSSGNIRAPGAGVPIMLSNGKILVPMYNSDTTVDTFVVESGDGGDTWTEYTVNTTYGSEFSIIETKTGGSYTGGIYGLIRDDSVPYVYKKVTSTDYGHTWSAASDESDFIDPYATPITLKRTPVDTLLAIYTKNNGDALDIYESSDEGINWNPTATIVSNASISYYPIIEFINTSSLIVAWCTNGATSDVYANFVDYPIVNDEWIIDNGVVSVANSEVVLDNTDIIRDALVRSYPLHWRSKINFATTTDYMLFGMAEEPGNEWCTTPSQDSFHFQALITGKDYPTTCNDGVNTQNVVHTGTSGDHIYGVKWKPNEIKWYYDDVLFDTFNTNTPNEPLQTKFDHRTGTHKVDWIMIAKYNDIEPIITAISEPNFNTDSLHYNASSTYNLTIESDGTLSSNRSITTADDTNDTAQSTGTSYLVINVFDNDATVVRNFIFIGDDLDWYQVANTTGTYDLKNSTGTIETQSNGNFTTNLTAGTYWIEKSGISISLVSFTPSPLQSNYIGVTTISYMVQSTNPLDLSTLAFLYGLNYTTTGDMHNYITTPPNDIAYEGLYLAPNRNVTPYLSWEFNDTITNSSVWQWGGGDNNSWWIEKNPVNTTHTYINATGVTQHILPSSFYIQKLAMYNAPKTGFEINRQQGLVFKMWNVEEIRNRGHNYFANLYFDTSWESTLPNYPVEVGFCNYSYDPTVDDIDTSQHCIKIGEWAGNRWVNHSWVPSANASYAYPLVVNGSQYTEPTPTDINYIWLRSSTISSKSYILNATDYDPGITNITFAQTETMWTYNELNGVTTPVAYTPSFFTTFVRNDEELLHHLYIADDTGVWGHSDIFNESIGLSSVPVPSVSFEYFNVTCDESYHDHEMDATYDQGAVGVGMHCPADPDGTTVSHNLTLHYYPNMTLVVVINNTFTTTGVEDVEIEFTTTPYYSSDTLYTLRCVSTDGDDNVATKWLISYFALDADGNQGWVEDDKLLFWGMNDIPTLYTEVNNNSLISYDGGSDVYTMHVPFFKSKGNDTFYFNESVHLESLNNEDVAYFRFTGRTVFDDATILGWNMTSDAPAPATDLYRAYVYSLTIACGNITNSNFSYLGGDFYRQEGLNFVDNSHEYLINNSVFSHNTEGPIFEECSNFTISNCTISDNVNVGIGIYFSDNFIVENNTISSNGGRGITMYESNDNIINYNDITNSGIHGLHYWSNSINNTCTGNDISGSALYDYYLSSSSTGNFIIDPESITDLIRVTSTSSVKIENTDNAAFSEDSSNTSYAYLTNFSMFVSGVSQTFDITQCDMTILPSIDKVAILNLEWDTSVKFNATSDTDINPTWFNITKSAWSNKTVYIYLNDTLYTNETANATGVLLYNYSESLTEKWFEFRTTLISLGVYVPLSIFMFMGILLFVFTGASFYFTGVFSIFTSLLSVMFAFIMSKIAINGTLIQNIGGFDSTGTVVQAVTIIEMPALSYILLFIGLFMVVILIIQVMREIEFRKSKDIIELDL